MKKLLSLAALLLLCCFASPALAQQSVTVCKTITTLNSSGQAIQSCIPTPTNGPFISLGCGTFSPSAATTIPNLPSGAIFVALSIEGQAVRYRDDGTAPTNGSGVLLPVGGPWPYSGPLVAGSTSGAKPIQFIQTAATATINWCAYK